MKLLNSESSIFLYPYINFREEAPLVTYRPRKEVFDKILFRQIVEEIPTFCIDCCTFKHRCQAFLQARVGDDKNSVVVNYDPKQGSPCGDCPIFNQRLVLACHKEDLDQEKPYRLILTYPPPKSSV